MDDPFSPERKTVRLNKQNLFGSGYAGLGNPSCVPNWGPPGRARAPGRGPSWTTPAARAAERPDRPLRIDAIPIDPPRLHPSRPDADPSRRPSRLLGRPLGRAIARIGR